MKISLIRLSAVTALVSGAICAHGDFSRDIVKTTMDAHAIAFERAEAFSGGFVSLKSDYVMSTNIDVPENGGSFDGWGLKGSAALYSASENGSEFVGLVSYQRQDLTWDPADGVTGGSFVLPGGTTYTGYDEVAQPSVSASYSLAIDERWNILALAGGAWSEASGAGYGDALVSPSISDAFYYSAGAAIRYNAPNVSVGLGFLYRGNLESSEDWLPLVMIDWRLSDAVTLRLYDGVYVFLKLDEAGTHQVEFSGRLYDEQYLLGQTPGSSSIKIAAEDEGWEFRVAYTYSSENGFYVMPYASTIMEREVELVSDEETLDFYEIAEGFTVGVELGYRF